MMGFVFSHRASCGLALAGAILCVGCNRTPAEPVSVTESKPATEVDVSASPAGVATIDVTAIAKQSGRLADINQQISRREAELNVILEGMRKIHLDEVMKMEESHGDDPTEEQKQELTQLRMKQASEYNRRWQETRLKLTGLKQRLDEQFLANVQPLARCVASEEGLSIVIRKENVFCATNAYDITSEVARRFVKAFPKQKKEVPVVETAQMPVRGGGFVPRR